MGSPSDPLTHLSTLLPASAVILPTSPAYHAASLTWATNRNLHPSLILRPTTLSHLSATVAYLAATDLDWKVRSRGFGSASAKDVLVCLDAFDSFEWDEENKIVTLGAGAEWSAYYEAMERVAPEYAIVAARTPCIGVGGSTLCGGFSWLSGEYGCVSDPENMLDAQVVKLDGSVAWASEEPELLWALRGTEGGFGIVTAFKFRARPYTQRIWSGPILIPRHAVDEVTRGILAMNDGAFEPKVAMFLYVIRKEMLKFIGAEDDMLVVHAYDALGEEHGRSEAGFKWALEIEGVIDQTKLLNLRGVSNLQEHIGGLKGTAQMYWSPIGLPTLTEEVISKAFDWYRSVESAGGSVVDNAWLLFELFSCRDAPGSRSEAGWPRPKGFRHMVLIGVGCAPDGTAQELATAKELARNGPKAILGESTLIDIIPNALEEFHDAKKIYGEHYSKLQEIKRRYDPYNKLKGPIPV